MDQPINEQHGQRLWAAGTFLEQAGEDAELYSRRGELRAIKTTGPFAIHDPVEGILQAAADWEGYVALDEHGRCFHMSTHEFELKFVPVDREVSSHEQDLRHAMEELAPKLDELIDLVTANLPPDVWPDFIARPDPDAAVDPDKARAEQGT